ncbi:MULTISPECIES: hypothetical protein [unclassified Solwaraspora]|uniref:hypothetical protein n=1 Tax=unclassified Solwaraspora TaxID=2627926 RepID=UPI00259B5513|nr:hypothetical protein [Solwaraspora sp. WMMA2056]WJK42520.1 hypothetical protein O7608_09145 [Solwaraspora sp. WMMA2056]
MTSADDLDWLDDLPKEWEMPQELRAPTGVPFVNFAIVVLSSDRTSNAIVLAVAELLAAKERFSIWCMTKGKEALGERRLLEFSLTANDLLRECWEAWLEYSLVEEWSADLYSKTIATWNRAKSRFGEIVTEDLG